MKFEKLAGTFIFFTVLTNTLASAATITMPDIGTFEAPDGFTALSPAEIQVKYARGHPPQFVMGNTLRTTMIAYELRAIPLLEEQLAEVKSSVETTLSQTFPGMEWKKKALVKMHGRSWIHFEYTTRGVDYDVYNIMLLTPFSGKVLLLNFSSPKEQFRKTESVLRKSIQTIALNPDGSNHSSR